MPSTLSTIYDIIFRDFVEPDLSKTPTDQKEGKSTRNKQDKIADLLGIDRLEPIKPTLDQLEAAKVKLESATDAKVRIQLESDITSLTAKSEKIKKDHIAFEANQLALQDFLSTYCTSPSLGKYLFGEDFNLKPKAEQDAKIQVTFRSYEVQGYFDENNLKHQELYKACYIMCMHRAQFVEHTNLDEVGDSAYKMMALFSPAEGQLQDNVQVNVAATFQKSDLFISKHVKSAQAVHDICLNRLPDYNTVEGFFNLEGWKEKLPIFGMKLVQNFSDLRKIEQIITQKSKADTAIIKVGEDKLPLDAASFDEALKRISYSRLQENPDLANVFKMHKAPELMFNRALDLMKDGGLKTDESKTKLLPKEVDNLPDLCIKVPGTEDIYMVKMPAHNPRSLILGHITNCCQSVGGNGESCAVDGVNLPNNGFYIFIKDNKRSFDPKNIDWDHLEDQKHKIIGQSYSWLGRDNSLTLDSLEVLGSFRNQINVAALAQEFGRAVSTIDPSISRIMIGTKGGTQSVLEEAPNNTNVLKEAISNAYMREGRQYGDSMEQYEVYTSEPLLKLREPFKGKIKDINIITSDKHAELLNALTRAELSQLEKYPQMLSHQIVTAYENADSLKAFYQVFNQYDDQKKEILSKRNIIEDCYTRKYYTFEEIEGMNIERIEALTSLSASKMYSLNSTAYQECKELPIDKTKALLSYYGSYVYAYFPEIFNELKKMEPEHITALTSEAAIALYTHKPEAFHVLQSVDIEKCKALTTGTFYKLYTSHPEALEDLKAMTLEEIKILAECPNREALYASHREIFIELKNMDSLKVESLTSERAIALYDKYPDAFNELKNMDRDKIQALTYAPLVFYEKYPYAFDELKKMDDDKIMHLTSSRAQTIYEKYSPAFDELKKMDNDKIMHLISSRAQIIYEKYPPAFDDLKNMDTLTLHYLLNWVPVEFYEQYPHILHDFATMNLSTIESLTSYRAMALYKESSEAFNDLKGMEEKKIQALTFGIQELCDMHPEAFNELKNMELEKIEAFARIPSTFYEKHPDAFNALKKMDAPKIAALTSEGLVELYDIHPEAFNELKNMEPEKIGAFRSGSSTFYEKHPEAFNELKKMDAPKIDALISYNLQELYDIRPEAFNELKNMELEKVQAFSMDATFYKEHPDAFNAFKKMDVPKIKVLTSYPLEKFYEKHPDAFNAFKKMDIQKIEVLTSDTLEELYEKDPKAFHALQNIDDMRILHQLTFRDVVQKCMQEPGILERITHLSTENISALITRVSYGYPFTYIAKELKINLDQKPDGTDRLQVEVKKIAKEKLAQHMHHDVTEGQGSHIQMKDLEAIGEVFKAAGASSTRAAKTTDVSSRTSSPEREKKKHGVE